MFKYVCQNFKDGQVLTADCLNKMEEGIENACQTPGPQGPKGDDGVSISHEWDGTTLKITSASGTSSADLRGPTGPIGIKGSPGDAGKSAYEYARDGGYMGSETKFSEQLAGIPDWDKTENYTANTTIVIPQQSLSSGMWMNRKYDIEPGIPYAVYIGGKEYFCIAGNEDGTIYLGNPKLFDSASTQAHNNEPFCITWAGGAATAGMFFKDSTLSYPLTLKVTGAAVTMEKKLPKEYLPDDVALKSDIPEGGGGADIDVVASVGQTIVVEEVDADGKPTKWKAAEFQERTHGKDIVELYNATLTGLAESGALIEGFSMQAGETYYITWNGVEYTCVCVEVPDTGGMRYIGNGSAFDLEDTGEPFIIVYGTEDGVNFFTLAISLDGVDEATVVITGTGYIPIPQEYLTNAFPYYIEVTGSGTEDDPYVCAETVENVEATYRSGRSMVARHTMTQETEHDAGVDRNTILSHYYLTSVLDSSNVPQGLVFAFLNSVEYPTVSNKQPMLYFLPQEDGTYAVSKSIG